MFKKQKTIQTFFLLTMFFSTNLFSAEESGWQQLLRELNRRKNNFLAQPLTGYSVTEETFQANTVVDQWRQGLVPQPAAGHANAPVDQLFERVGRFRFVETRRPNLTVGQGINRGLVGALIGTAAAIATYVGVKETNLDKHFNISPTLTAALVGAGTTALRTRNSLHHAWVSQFTAGRLMEEVVTPAYSILEKTDRRLRELTGGQAGVEVATILSENYEPTSQERTMVLINRLSGTMGDVEQHNKLIAILKADQEATSRLIEVLRKNQGLHTLPEQFSVDGRTRKEQIERLEHRLETAQQCVGAINHQNVRPSEAAYNLYREAEARAAARQEGQLGRVLASLPQLTQFMMVSAPVAAGLIALLQQQQQVNALERASR